MKNYIAFISFFLICMLMYNCKTDNNGDMQNATSIFLDYEDTPPFFRKIEYKDSCYGFGFSIFPNPLLDTIALAKLRLEDIDGKAIPFKIHGFEEETDSDQHILITPNITKLQCYIYCDFETTHKIVLESSNIEEVLYVRGLTKLAVPQYSFILPD